MKRRAVLFLQHHLNPLHVYCRLRERGVGEDRAWAWASRWEKIYKIIQGIRRAFK